MQTFLRKSQNNRFYEQALVLKIGSFLKAAVKATV
jgi:hypothetical protein